MAELARKSSPPRPQLAAVPWRLPSSPPDTSHLDADWSDEHPPRESFISLKGARAKGLPRAPEPPPLPRRLSRPSAPPSARRSLPPSSVLAAEVVYDVWDGPRAMLVLVDLPGVAPEELSLTLGSRALFLEVAVPAIAQRPGIASGHHQLSVELPEGLDAEALDASLSNGVLRVRISKTEAGPRRVPIASID
jgi:HSP20 family protein